MARPSADIVSKRNRLFLEGLYLCGKCSGVRPLLEFGKDSRARHGVKTMCKPCINDGNYRGIAKIKQAEGLDAWRARRKRFEDKWKQDTRPKRLEHFKLKIREANIRNKYGLSLSDVEKMFAEQGERCGICSTVKPQSRWHIDHGHRTGEIRGILCNLCNVGLGAFRDNPDALAMAQIYLRPRGKI